MKPPNPSSLKRACIYSALCSLVFSVPAIFLINNHFVPIKKSFLLKQNDATRISLTLKSTAPLLLKVKVPVHDPANHPGYNPLSVVINGRNINEGSVKKYYTRHQINLIVPGSYFRSKRENEILLRLPPPSPKDSPFVAPYIKISNYRHISPNIPVAFIIFDSEDDSKLPSIFPEMAGKLTKVFFIVFSTFLFYQVMIGKIFFTNYSESLPAGNRFMAFAAMIPWLFLAFDWITPYRIIFPEMTLFWLLALGFLLFYVLGVFLVGAVFPKANEFLVPGSLRGNQISRKILQKVHEKVLSSIENGRSSLRFKTILVVLAAIPVLIYWFHIFENSVNIPVFDDIAAFSYLSNLDHTDGFFEKLQLTFGLHNDHRPVFYRSVLWASYHLTGEVNFRSLAILGSSAMLFFLFLFYKIFPKTDYKPVHFLPIIAFFLCLNSWTAMTKPIHLWVNFYVHCFAGLSIYLLIRSTPFRFILAMLLASMATYTQGGGMLVFIVGGACLILNKEYQRGGIWFVWAVLNIAFYFDDFRFMDAAAWQIRDTMTPVNFSLFFFSFLGASLSFGKFHFAVPAGLGCFFFTFYLTRRKYYLKNPRVYFFILYMLLIGLAVAYGRTRLGIETALSFRYQINSAILLVLIYISMQDLFFKGNSKKLLPVLYLTLFTFLYHFYSVKEFSGRMRNDTKMFLNNLRTSLPQDFPETHSSGILVQNAAMLDALQNKRYYLPCARIFPGKTIEHKWCK